jgi:hypothetical protein
METVKSVFLSLLFFVFCLFNVSGQTVEEWRAGSAFHLSGNVYTLSCFVSGPDDEWTNSEKLAVFDKLNEATAWIKNQAKKYNITVNFEGGSYGFEKDIKLEKIERGIASGKEKTDWVDTVLRNIGYSRTIDLYNWVKANTICENVQIIIFVKGFGNGYAVAFAERYNKELYFVEGAILYENHWNGVGLLSSSIAHEILHLYGAWDLYKTFEQTQDREDKARELFPDSIMLRVSYNIDDLYVDEVTAWLVGWNTDPKPWYSWFNPRQR